MKMKVITAPDSVLKAKCIEVNSVNSEVQNIMLSMVQAMRAEGGIGLAANQVGIKKRIIVIDLQDRNDEKRSSGFYPLFMANPQILYKSSEESDCEEGCLSLPGYVVRVKRPKEILAQYLDYNGSLQTVRSGELLARVIQHECDHLNGKLIIDYLSMIKKDSVLRKLAKNRVA